VNQNHEELIPAHYYEVVAEGIHAHHSIVGRYRSTVRLRGVVYWWLTGAAFQILVDPDDVVEVKHLGRLYGRTI
jgi:hypothetical protein